MTPPSPSYQSTHQPVLIEEKDQLLLVCSLGPFSIGPHPGAFGHGSVPWHRSLGECVPCWMLSNGSEWSLMSLKTQRSVWRCSPGKITICAPEDWHTHTHTHTHTHSEHSTGFLQPQRTIVLEVNRAGTWSVTVPLWRCVFVDWCRLLCVYVRCCFVLCLSSLVMQVFHMTPLPSNVFK